MLIAIGKASRCNIYLVGDRVGRELDCMVGAIPDGEVSKIMQNNVIAQGVHADQNWEIKVKLVCFEMRVDPKVHEVLY